MVLKDAAGAVLTVDQGEAAFNAAMAAPEPGQAPPPEMPAPAKVDPEAPFGRTQDGKPKKGPGGRPPKHDKPRVQTAAAGPSGEVRDYTAELTEITQGVYLLMAIAPPTQAQAALWKGHAPTLVHAWNIAARQNETVRGGVEWLTGSGATWIMAVGMATAPLVLQSIALWRDPKGEMALQLQAATVADLQAMASAQEQAMRAAAAA